MISTLAKSSCFGGTGASYFFVSLPHSLDLTVGSTVFVLNPAHKLRRLALRAELELAVLLGKPISTIA